MEFSSHASAERILQTYNGTHMPGTEQTFGLNWDSFGIGERRPDAGPEHSIFVGDLTPDVTDYLLQETFRSQYPSVTRAEVVTDPNTGRSKGYGFVKFSDETERNRAMTEMNGVYCSTRPMRISTATPEKTTALPQVYPAVNAVHPVPTYAPVQAITADTDVSSTIYVGSLDPNVSEDELKQIFGQSGEVVYVTIPPTKGSGFVQFSNRAAAEEAMQKLQGTMIGQQPVRLSWDNNLVDDFQEEPVEMVKHAKGTIQLAFVLKKGVMLAVYSQASMSGDISSKSVRKIIKINPQVVCTMAGGAADYQFLHRNFRKKCRLYEAENNRRISVAAASDLLSNSLFPLDGRTCFPVKTLSVGTVFAGWDETGPTMYYVDRMGARIEATCLFVGCSSPYALKVLENGYRYNMSIEKAAELTRQAMSFARFRDGASGIASVYYFGPRGLIEVSRVDVAELRKNSVVPSPVAEGSSVSEEYEGLICY